MTKVCTRCENELPLEEFPWRNKSRGTRASWCKPCKQAYESEHYRKSDTRKKQIRTQVLKQVERNKEIVAEAKSTGCVDCGEQDLIVLEFDHLRDKSNNVSTLMHSGSTQKLIAEIEKCEVVCANCHRRRTHRRLAGKA